MRFYSAYELKEIVADGPVTTFLAVETDSRRRVYIHLLADDSSLSEEKALLQKVQSLGSSAGVLLIDKFGETPYVVTEVLKPFTNFEEWVEARLRDRPREGWSLPRPLKEAVAPLIAAVGLRWSLLLSVCVRWFSGFRELVEGGLEMGLRWAAGCTKRANHWLTQPGAASGGGPANQGEIDDQLERFALHCYATAVRLREEGNAKLATVVAGKGLAAYRKRNCRVPAGVKWSLSPSPATRLRWFEIANRPWVPATLGLAAALGLAALTLEIWSLQRASAPTASGRAVTIRTSPPGAMVSLNGQPCGVSPCQVELPAGIYQAEAKRDGYQPASGSFDLRPEAASVTHVVLTLSPLAPSLRLVSDLSEAYVMLDGEPAGMMADGKFDLQLDPLEEGVHRLSVVGAAEQASIVFEARPGAAPVLVEPLHSRNLRAVVVASLGSRARIYADRAATPTRLGQHELVEVGHQGLEWDSLEEGPHELVINPDSQDARNLTFHTGPQPMLTAYLKADRPFGGLRIVTGEDDVEVYFNGKKYRRATRDGRLTAYLYPNTYRVRVEKDGFVAPEERIVTVREGERVNLAFSLVPDGPRAPLLVRNGLPGSKVTLEGNPSRTIGLYGGVTASF